MKLCVDERVVRTFVVGLLLAGAACTRESGAAPQTPPPPAVNAGAPSAPAPAAAPAPAQESPLQKVLAQSTLADAIAAAKPSMTDTENDVSPSTLLLSGWSIQHLKWEDVSVKKDETSYALVQKDSDEERGKRMCVGGLIVEITVEKSDLGKSYSGLLVNRSSQIFSFVAVGSTGKLVGGSWGHFCGVVTGRYDYSNSAGGTGHAIQLVGMFDLPENKPAGAALATARRRP